jgi:hypothetical protein
MTNGHDNSGKSLVTWYLALLSAMYHDWHWIIYSSENSLGSFMRRMIEFYWGKPLHGYNQINDIEFRIGKQFIESHFTLIKAEDVLFNYKDIINISKKCLQKKYYHSILVDPYNSLKIELTPTSKLSTHEYHYEALSEIKLFIKKEGTGMWVNNHAVTNALRTKGADGMAAAPQKADTEGGGKFSNKADDFLTIHRKTQHPKEWMYSEIHVRKIKETETGGRVTPLEQPIRLIMQQNGCAFVEEDVVANNGVNAVKLWHGRDIKTNEIKFVPPKQDGWQPINDFDGDFNLPF